MHSDPFTDSGKVLQTTDKSLQAIESRQMEAFAIHTQERIMGLLGAMIPRDNMVSLLEIWGNNSVSLEN